MVRLIQKSGYIKSGGAGGYMKYIATRERVEKLEGSGPITKNQEALLKNLLRDFPDAKELDEYKDYSETPTSGSASALISAALDANAHEVVGRDGYMKYIATRPRVERHSEHGLFSSRPVSLNDSLKEIESHTGNVWTFIWSLRREDAARLGYDHAERWRKLLMAHQVEIAAAIKIPPDQLRWRAAFHDEGGHPHIHAMVWSADPKHGYLTTEGINTLRSKLTNEIFQDELYSLYQEKDISYKELVAAARQSMRELIKKMRTGLCDSLSIGEKMLALSQSLETAKCKKVYGYLKKSTKAQVDAIVDELANIPGLTGMAWASCRMTKKPSCGSDTLLKWGMIALNMLWARFFWSRDGSAKQYPGTKERRKLGINMHNITWASYTFEVKMFPRISQKLRST